MDAPIKLYFQNKDTDNWKTFLHCNSSQNPLPSLLEITKNFALVTLLPPSYACFIGFEYAKTFKASLKHSNLHQKLLKNTNNSSIKNTLYSINRDGTLSFLVNNSKIIEMFPLEILQSNHLIKKFNATDAFYIGLYAGIQLDKASLKNRCKSSLL